MPSNVHKSVVKYHQDNNERLGEIREIGHENQVPDVASSRRYTDFPVAGGNKYEGEFPPATPGKEVITP